MSTFLKIIPCTQSEKKIMPVHLWTRIDRHSKDAKDKETTSGRQRSKETDRQIDRLTILTYTQPHRQKNRQTDRHTDK